MTAELPWIEEARKWLGTRCPDIATMQTFVDVTEVAQFDPDTQPWSGLFAGFVMAQSGIEPPPGFMDPKVWTAFGEALVEPEYGCVVATPNHVALYLGEDADWLFVLGGNQADTVGVSALAKSASPTFRWPVEADSLKLTGRINTTIEEAQKSIASS